MSKRVSRVCKWCGHKVTFDVEKHDKHIYNKAIDDAKSIVLQTLENEMLVDTLHLRLDQLKAGVGE